MTSVPALDFSRFEILTFDCYGTLIDWEAGILGSSLHSLRPLGKKIDDATILNLYGDFEQRFEKGAFRPYREVLESVVRQFAAELHFTPSPEEVRCAFRWYRTSRCCAPGSRVDPRPTPSV